MHNIKEIILAPAQQNKINFSPRSKKLNATNFTGIAIMFSRIFIKRPRYRKAISKLYFCVASGCRAGQVMRLLREGDASPLAT